MSPRKIFFIIFTILVIVIFPILTNWYITTYLRAAPVKANIQVNTRKIVGIMPLNWKALAQGGEEGGGVRMLENVVPQTAALYPRYIRLDHIYDFYDVVKKEGDNLSFNWEKLDATVCDIYRIGARPFFALGYMPPSVSSDGSLIGNPSDWNDWAEIVQKTIERYSGQETRLCDQVTGDLLSDIYYEVWNEPDLETFGKWSIYGGAKSYKNLYFHAAKGAERAQNVNHFYLGGPSTTALYRNWIITFLDYANANNLRVDFISWHHYSKNPYDYTNDVVNLNSWLARADFEKYRFRHKIITEWGYDSNPNAVAETNLGAAHTIASIRNLIEQNVKYAFVFEVKDGHNPTWGILTRDGQKKTRYNALKLLNGLQRNRLDLAGEGTFVKAIASNWRGRTNIVLVNFDPADQNNENVPVTFNGLTPGTYQLTMEDAEGHTTSNNIEIEKESYTHTQIMTPNSIVALELQRL